MPNAAFRVTLLFSLDPLDRGDERWYRALIHARGVNLVQEELPALMALAALHTNAVRPRVLAGISTPTGWLGTTVRCSPTITVSGQRARTCVHPARPSPRCRRTTRRSTNDRGNSDRPGRGTVPI